MRERTCREAHSLPPLGGTAPERVAVFALEEAEMADRRRAQQLRIRLLRQGVVKEFVRNIEGRPEKARWRLAIALCI